MNAHNMPFFYYIYNRYNFKRAKSIKLHFNDVVECLMYAPNWLNDNYYFYFSVNMEFLFYKKEFGNMQLGSIYILL